MSLRLFMTAADDPATYDALVDAARVENDRLLAAQRRARPIVHWQPPRPLRVTLARALRALIRNLFH